MSDLVAIVERLNADSQLSRDATFYTKGQDSLTKKFAFLPDWDGNRIIRPNKEFRYLLTATDDELQEKIMDLLMQADASGLEGRRLHITFVSDDEVRPASIGPETGGHYWPGDTQVTKPKDSTLYPCVLSMEFVGQPK
jgi:hypothetical protein